MRRPLNSSIPEITAVRDIDQVRSLAETWSKLSSRQSFDSVYQTWEFHYAWWQAFDKGHTPYVLVAKRNSVIITIVPLVLSVELGKRVLRFWGSPNFDYHDVIGDNNTDTIRALLVFLYHNRSEWDSIHFEQISERSPTLSALCTAAGELNLTWMKRESDRCYVFEYDGPPEEQTEYRLRRGGNYRRVVNHFNRFGGYELKRITDLTEAKQALQLLFYLHIIRWKDSPSPSKFHSENNRSFYHCLVDNLWGTGKVFMVLLTVGKVPIACLLSFEHDKTVFLYTLSYSRFFARRSPGAFFVTEQSEKLIRDHYRLDFCRGSQDYKKIIASDSFGNYEFRLYSSGKQALTDRIYEHMKKSAIVSKLTANRLFMRKKHVFDALSLRHGKARALYHLLFGKQKPHRKQLLTLYKLASKPVENSGKSDYRCVELSPSDELLLASFLGIVDQSSEHMQLRENFGRGDRHLGVMLGSVLLASARITSTATIPELPEGFVVPDNVTTVMADLIVAEVGGEFEICRSLLIYAKKIMNEETPHLLSDPASGPKEGLLKQLGFCRLE